ncbi:MAG: Mov34/MPN/PAD-1 family protein [Methanobrevibacter sp.]|nr:Mov34/MPN/PAD-1 family protein [Methanobrevibacter sp.]
MSFISKIFNNDEEEFDEVCVDREVLDSVIYYSKKAFPNEFLAFFDGEIINRKLYITSLIFIPGETGQTGAVVHTEMLPINTKYWGSVHSHPGPSAMPSGADLKTFSKNGFFHMIVCLPYSLETFRAYDRHGNPQDYTIGNYGHLVDDNSDEFFDESDVVRDDEVFKPGLLDEKDDEFFKTINEKPASHYDKNNMEPNQVIRIELGRDGKIERIIRENKK